MLQYCFPNESIAGVYHTSQLALAKYYSTESPDSAATLFSKSFNVARREIDGGPGSFAIFLQSAPVLETALRLQDATPHDN